MKVTTNIFHLLLLFILCLLTGCGTAGASPSPHPPIPSPPTTEPTPQVIIPESTPTSAAVETPTEPETAVPITQDTEVAPHVELENRSDVIEQATNDLARKLNVPAAQIEVVASGSWSTDAIACELAISPEQTELLLGSERKQIILEFKGTQYEYWGFYSAGSLSIIASCLPEK